LNSSLLMFSHCLINDLLKESNISSNGAGRGFKASPHQTTTTTTETTTLSSSSTSDTPEDHEQVDVQLFSASILANINSSSNQGYPPSPNAEITPRRRSTRKITRPKTSPPSPKRLLTVPRSKSRRGTTSRRKKNTQESETANQAPVPISVLNRSVDVSGLVPPDVEEEDWGANVSLYKLVRLWMSDGIDTSSFSLPESVLLGMHDNTPPLTLPAPIPQRENLPPPAYQSDDGHDFEKIFKTGSEVPMKSLLEGHIAHFRAVKQWWKINHTHRLSRYRNRLSVLFPEQAHQQSRQQNQPVQQHP